MNIDNRYWAGLFDGEGSIYIDKKCTGFLISVTQKETPILYLLRNRYQGRVVKYDCQAASKWVVSGKKKMVTFLEAIAPYSIIKAIEIRLALEMLEGVCKFPSQLGTTNAGFPLPAYELERRKSLRERFMAERAETKMDHPA